MWNRVGSWLIGYSFMKYCKITFVVYLLLNNHQCRNIVYIEVFLIYYIFPLTVNYHLSSEQWVKLAVTAIECLCRRLLCCSGFALFRWVSYWIECAFYSGIRISRNLHTVTPVRNTLPGAILVSLLTDKLRFTRIHHIFVKLWSLVNLGTGRKWQLKVCTFLGGDS